MQLKKLSLLRGLVIGSALLALLFAGTIGYAKTIKYKSSGAGTFVTTNFSYDGAAMAGLFTASGKDNLGGPITFQCVAELVASATACVAPDGTAGTTFDLVQSDCAGQYTGGHFQFNQTYSTAVGTAAGTQCVSDTTGSLGGTVNYTVTGGSGKLTGLSGFFTVSFTGKTLATGGTPPGNSGLFGGETFTATGTVSNAPIQTPTPTPSPTPTSTPTSTPTVTPTATPTATP